MFKGSCSSSSIVKGWFSSHISCKSLCVTHSLICNKLWYMISDISKPQNFWVKPFPQKIIRYDSLSLTSKHTNPRMVSVLHRTTSSRHKNTIFWRNKWKESLFKISFFFPSQSVISSLVLHDHQKEYVITCLCQSAKFFPMGPFTADYTGWKSQKLSNEWVTCQCVWLHSSSVWFVCQSEHETDSYSNSHQSVGGFLMLVCNEGGESEPKWTSCGMSGYEIRW